MKAVGQILDDQGVLLGSLVRVDLLPQFVEIAVSLIDRDLLRLRGVLGNDRHVAVIVQGHEAAVTGDDLAGTVRSDDLGCAGREGREEGLVSGKETNITLGGPNDDVDRLPLPDLAVGADDLDLKRRVVHGTQPSFFILSQFSITMSMLPTLKKACSGTWSTSPRQIIWNPSMVSAMETVEPGTPVNFSPV